MLYSLLITLWLLIGSITFGIGLLNKTMIPTYYTLIKCTMLGLISLLLLFYHLIINDDINIKAIRRAKKSQLIVLILLSITFASCGNNTLEPCGVVTSIRTHNFIMTFMRTNGTSSSYSFNSERLDTIKLGNVYCLQSPK